MRCRNRTPLFAFLALCLLCETVSAATVRVVEFELAAPMKRHDVREMLPVRPGDEYSPALVQRSVRLLEATGLFGSVEAEAEEADEGWRVFFRLVPHELVRDVALGGNFLVLKRELSPILRLRKGDRFSEEKAREDAAALLRTYEEKGYRGTKIRTDVRKGEKGVSIIYHIDEGRPGIVRKVAFEGNDSFPDGELTPLLRFSLYAFVSQGQVVDSVEKIEQFYRDKGFLDITVTPQVERGEGAVVPGLTFTNPVKALATILPGQYEAVDITLRIDEGSRYTVELEGGGSFSDQDLMAQLTFAETGFFDEHEAGVGRRHLLEFYDQRGHYLVTVRFELDQDERKVRYIIEEGERFTVAGTDFRGISFFDRADVLSRLMTWQEEVGIEKILRRDRLEEGARQIRDLFIEEGFADVEVEPAEVVLDEDAREAEVLFAVREGTRYVVGDVSFEGVTALPEEKLRGAIMSVEGTPYRPGDVTRDKTRLLALVGAEGYPKARISEKVHLGGDGSVNLRYIVQQGERMFVGKVIVVTSGKTKDKVVVRDFTLHPGEPYSLPGLAEGKRALYGLGIFEQVKIETPPPVEGTGVQDLVITVRERPTGHLRVGVGYNSDERFGGFAEIGEQNLFGGGRGVSLRGKFSAVERRYDFFFREPWPLGYRINSEANLFEEFREEKGYDTVRRGVSVGIKEEFRERFTVNLKYRFEFVDYENVELTFEDPAGQSQEVGPLERINISSIIALLGYDLRDDPVRPHRGSYHLAGAEFASPALGGDTSFNKYTFETSWYFPVTERSEIAFGFRGGFSQTLAGFETLPLSERFFLGGARGVRGYAEDEVGPKDSAGNPIGGDASALGIAEYRFPIFGGNWRGVVFLDVGNVWADLEEIEPTEARTSVGVGLRYNTIVGPLRLDYGFKLNPEEGEDPGRFHFSIGFPF